ncbi:MAG: hypothetical protein V3S09_05165 [Candidatus Bathyarchaeia archaeon]
MGTELTVSGMSRNGAGNQSHATEIPAWTRDNLVLKLLDDNGLKLEIMYDQKYLNGLYSNPLILIKGKRDAKEPHEG